MSGIARNDRFRWIALAAAVASLCSLVACATITQGNSQAVSVITDPSGAACLFVRDDQIVGVVNPTPGSIQLQKKSSEVLVRCSKPGYVDAWVLMHPKAQGATAGNILLGGLIGFAVDAASGATHAYETQVSLTLASDTFESAQARDAYFDQQMQAWRQQTKIAEVNVASSCRSAGCDGRLAAIHARDAEGLSRLERQRAEAKIKER